MILPISSSVDGTIAPCLRTQIPIPNLARRTPLGCLFYRILLHKTMKKSK